MRISDWSSDVFSSDLAKRMNRDLSVQYQGGYVGMITRHLAPPLRAVVGAQPHQADIPRTKSFYALDLHDGEHVHLLFCPGAMYPLIRTNCRANRCSRSEEHTSELQSLMRISYAVFCLKKKKKAQETSINNNTSYQITTR